MKRKMINSNQIYIKQTFFCKKHSLFVLIIFITILSSSECDKNDEYNMTKDYSSICLGKDCYYASGFMGSINSITMDGNYTDNTGKEYVKIVYNTNNSEGWGGIYWLANASWFGPGFNIEEYFNLNQTKSIKLKFLCKGETGKEIINFKVGGVTDGDDSVDPAIETDWINLSNEWIGYKIDLTGQNLTNLVGGFCWVTENDKNPDVDKVIFYLDSIMFEADNLSSSCIDNTIPLYQEGSENENYIWKPGGWMGATNSLSLNDTCTEKPFQGKTCIRINYNTNNSIHWAGIYWLANDSWTGPGVNVYEKYNISNKCNFKLTFWCRGNLGLEKSQFKVGGVKDGDDSINQVVETEWLNLTTDWTKYEIDLAGKNLSHLVGGFCWVTENAKNRSLDNVTIYLDNIQYETY